MSCAVVQMLDTITCKALVAPHTPSKCFFKNQAAMPLDAWELLSSMTARQNSLLLHAAKYNGILPADIHLTLTDSCHHPASETSQLGTMEGNGISVKQLYLSTLHPTAPIPCASHWPAALPSPFEAQSNGVLKGLPNSCRVIFSASQMDIDVPSSSQDNVRFSPWAVFCSLLPTGKSYFWRWF